MIRALRGDNIEEPVESPKAESRMAVVIRSADDILSGHYTLQVAGYIFSRTKDPGELFRIAGEINAEVDKRCREAVKAELARLRGLVHRI